MERLTMRLGDHIGIKGLSVHIPEDKSECTPLAAALARLAEYEDAEEVGQLVPVEQISPPEVDIKTMKRGVWIRNRDGYAHGYPLFSEWYCSECGYCLDEDTFTPNTLPMECPNCEAKMY